MKIHRRCSRLCLFALLLAVLSPSLAAAISAPQPVTLATGWRLQDVAKVPQAGAEVSSAAFDDHSWYAATVPGTVLTSLVNDHVYPEPLYGENERPEVIPESLVHTSYWYRTVIRVPRAYSNHHVWLNFDGINYAADVWVNGVKIGATRGAFIRGIFDITEQVKVGRLAVVAVLVAPQPHPGDPHEHTIRNGVGKNGGLTAIDGPTFLSTIGWDWLNAVRDRDTGIWQKVSLSATGPVLLKDPLVTTDLPLPRTDSSDVAVQATVENVSDRPMTGLLEGTIENIVFERQVTLAPHSTQQITFDSKSTPALHIDHPRLWWPNGYGAQEMYQLHLAFTIRHSASDAADVDFGVRKITYSVPGTDTLTISVNGVPIFIRGGDWGLDEAMKRIPRERLDAEIHMHQLAHLNLIRNWVGQSTGEDFYELCDKYGILVWDEFFQPNPADGPDPTDLDTYVANVRDKVLRFRNHPSIALWCARNEGYPPPEIDAALRKVLAELEPTRRYQPSSTDGAGVRSHGPYYWRAPREFYTVTDDYFKTETGSMSVPTLESIHGMMPHKDWEVINDDWAAHDFAKGAQRGDLYPVILAGRYGKIANLADFVRKAQLMNYEAFRAMYEGRNAQLFHPTTAIITWMSDPAQPSFVWQLYHYDLEPNASLFAVMHASEMVHIQLNEANGQVQVINNTPQPLTGLVAHVALYDLDGSLLLTHDLPVTAAPDAATNLGEIYSPQDLSNFPQLSFRTYFVSLSLYDPHKSGPLTYSNNFYWQAPLLDPDNLAELDKIPQVTLDAQNMVQKDEAGERTVTLTLKNPTPHIALMVHVQLRRKSGVPGDGSSSLGWKSGERVLPAFYSDNYVTLLPHTSTAIEMHAAISDFHSENALVTVDGWNDSIAPATFGDASIAPNLDAQPDHSPATGLPFATEGLR